MDLVVFAYSDATHEHVMHVASRALATGADFALLGPASTMLKAGKPVIAVSAVRTGCGKSQTARWIARRLRGRGLRVVVIRHPMPYGDLARQAVQRFAARADLSANDCTIEEREEYEPHLAAGHVVFAGVDYARIVAAAEAEADIILWDGGNNDFPFVRPDLHIVLVDPMRPGDETRHHPGEAVLRMADVILVAKTNAVDPANVDRVVEAARQANPRALIVKGASPVRLDDPDAVRGRRVVVVEDGPTTTHGGMPWGAGYVAALDAGAAGIVDPRRYADPEMAALYDRYPRLGPVLPAMGYSPAQLAALARSIDDMPADIVVSGTPVDLAALVQLNKPVVRARYEFAEATDAALQNFIGAFDDAETKTFLTGHSDGIRRIFDQSKTQNLRLLDQSLRAWERMHKVIEPAMKKKQAGMLAAFDLFLALSLETRSGRIGKNNLTGRIDEIVAGQMKKGDKEDDEGTPLSRAQDRYQRLLLHDSILSDEVLVQVLCDGRIDAQAINASLAVHQLFVEPNEEPNWRKVWHGFLRDAAEFEPAFKAMEQMNTGIFYVNSSTIGAEVHLPFGGTKGTGNGHREGAMISSLDIFSEWKSIYVDYSGKLQKAQIDVVNL